MVFMELHGDNDFKSIFPTVAEEVKQDEERKQTELFLQMLDDIEERNTGNSRDQGGKEFHHGSRERDRSRRRGVKHRRLRPRKYYREYDYDSDSSSSVSDYYSSEDEYYHRSRPRRRYRKPNREYMKVSITDDEKRRMEREKKERDEETARRRKYHGKVHTLDDLPPEELNFSELFGFPSAPEPPEVNVTAGRRLKDGKTVYNAFFPDMLDLGFDFNNVEIQVEYVLLFILVIFLIGIFIGRRASVARHKKQLQEINEKHTKQLNLIQQHLSREKTQQQPIYIPVVVPGNQTSQMQNQ